MIFDPLYINVHEMKLLSDYQKVQEARWCERCLILTLEEARSNISPNCFGISRNFLQAKQSILVIYKLFQSAPSAKRIFEQQFIGCLRGYM